MHFMTSFISDPRRTWSLPGALSSTPPPPQRLRDAWTGVHFRDSLWAQPSGTIRAGPGTLPPAVRHFGGEVTPFLGASVSARAWPCGCLRWLPRQTPRCPARPRVCARGLCARGLSAQEAASALAAGPRLGIAALRWHRPPGNQVLAPSGVRGGCWCAWESPAVW